MIVSVEISYNPMTDQFNEAIDEFIALLNTDDIELQVGRMSSIVIGKIDRVMTLLGSSFKILMEKYPSVFHLKVSNSCPLKL